MRVCLDIRSVGASSGGLQQLVIGLMHGLGQLEAGDEYVFLTRRGAEWLRPYLQGGCSLVEAGTPSVGAAAVAHARRVPGARRAWHHVSPLLGARTVVVPRSDGAIERLRPDVVHFPAQNAVLTDVPSVYQPHDLQYVHLPEHFSRRARLVAEVRARALCNEAEVIAVAWEWGRRDLLAHFDLPEDKIRVIPLAPVLTAYPEPSADEIAAARVKFALPDAFAFYPAQTWPHKNHLRLLEGLARLRDERRIEVPLVCSGHQNEFFPTIMARVRELRLERQTWWVGHIAPVELQALYRLARCVVVPTLFEAGSFPLWEAFVTGTAAACSTVTALPEQAGAGALLFDPTTPAEIAAAIERLWTDPALRAQLAAAGRTEVSGYTWPRTAALFRDAYVAAAQIRPAVAGAAA